MRCVMHWDPNRLVVAAERLQLGEQVEQVAEHHRRARVRRPNLRAHSDLHVTVEDQVPEGNESAVSATLQPLIGQGLDRDQAIHALASVPSGGNVAFFAAKPPVQGQAFPNGVDHGLCH
jgi:hypothetical protein